jgi:hypothetical protein
MEVSSRLPVPPGRFSPFSLLGESLLEGDSNLPLPHSVTILNLKNNNMIKRAGTVCVF